MLKFKQLKQQKQTLMKQKENKSSRDVCRGWITGDVLAVGVLNVKQQWASILSQHLSLTFPSVSGRHLGIISQHPSVSKSSWLHVDIFWFLIVRLRYILQILLT